ncbi:MAG: 7-cyano-7-deazaguanine synthase [Acidobacteriota bacterium]
MTPVRTPSGSVAVLFSGGLDSAVLLADACARAAKDGTPGIVQPIYVSAGLAWEQTEQAAAARLLHVPPYAGCTLPLVSLTVDMRDVYPPSHWAVRGAAPAYDTPDEDVYIEGRNIVLLSKAAVYMARAGLERVLMGSLAGNPFPDATDEFFAAMGRALSLGLGAPIAIEAPLASMHKADVIRLGRTLGVPLQLSISCMQPSGGQQCGRCSKCRERADAFRQAGGADPAARSGQG